MSHDIGPIAVDLHPRDRLVQRRSVEQAALGAGRRVDLEEPRLHRHDVLQSFDVAPGDREHPDLDAPLERVSREKRTTTGKTQRLEQRANKDGVRQRVW